MERDCKLGHCIFFRSKSPCGKGSGSGNDEIWTDAFACRIVIGKSATAVEFLRRSIKYLLATGRSFFCFWLLKQNMRFLVVRSPKQRVALDGITSF